MPRQILWLWLRSTPWHKSQLILLQYSNQHKAMVISHTHTHTTKQFQMCLKRTYELKLIHSHVIQHIFSVRWFDKSFLMCTATVHAHMGQFYPQTFILTKVPHLLKNKHNILHCAAILQCAPVGESADNGVKRVHPSTPLSPSHLALTRLSVSCCAGSMAKSTPTH